MNRQLKGFAAMNAIAENLRGRTVATREVEFAVNNSKENKAMFGIKRVAIGDGERGLLYKNRRFERVLAPGVYRLWDAFGALEVRSFDITRPDFIGKDVDALIERLGAELELTFALADIGIEEVGLVSKSGKLEDVLAPGMRKLYWKGLVSVTIDTVPLRTKVAKYSDYLYRELQYGLRKVVSAKTLDELLGDKASLDGDIFAYVRGRVSELGIEVLGVGIKDVILPGEMKEILNSVVQAEKAAQANIIRRREETNATRSALNTAKLIEDNPILMRLKELEALEKVTEKIDKLTVFGGLDGVLNQLVKLR